MYAYGVSRVSESQLISGTWKPSFYGYDGHGNVRLLANSAGTVTDTYQFDAFGSQIASTGTTPNTFLFSGEQFDSGTGLLYLRARYYRMPTGRFLTMDPEIGRIQEPGMLHKYVYTRNNPVNAIDPTGRFDLLEYAAKALDFENKVVEPTTTNPDVGVVVQTNDSFGKPLSITDPLNRTTSFTYDAKQNLVSQTDGLGKTTTYTYDANGFQTSVRDPLANTSTKVYNQLAWVES